MINRINRIYNIIEHTIYLPDSDEIKRLEGPEICMQVSTRRCSSQNCVIRTHDVKEAVALDNLDISPD